MKKSKRKQVGINQSSGADKVENIVNEKDLALGAYGANAMGGLANPTVGYTTGNPVVDPLLVGTAANVLADQQPEQKSEEEIILEKRKRARDKKTVKLLNERRKEKQRLAERERLEAERRIQNAQKRENTPKRGDNNGESGGNHNRKKGVGGWIAAVSILGATTLALGATVTVGAIEKRDTQRGIATAHQSNLYELIALVEYADSDLDRVRVSNSPAQQSRILTDLLVQTRLAENTLEKLPIDGQSNGNLTAFLNRTSALCERLLSKLRRGQVLEERDFAELEGLLSINKKTRERLDSLLGKYDDMDWLEYLKDKDKNDMKETLRDLENATLDENHINRGEMPDIKTGATPKNSQQEKLSSSKAEELCRGYFSEYKISSVELQGETVSRKMQAYNFALKDENGVALYAQLSSVDGELISFDYYEYCVEQNLSIDSAKAVAEEFLEKLGKDDMTAVKVNEMGSTASFTFVYEQDGVICYPDTIEVKVCEQKGVVVGYNASRYLRHHKLRPDVKPTLSMEQATAKLSPKLQLDGGRVAIIQTMRGEKLAYELGCSYDGQIYLVYIDAETGDELSILNVGKTAK